MIKVSINFVQIIRFYTGEQNGPLVRWLSFEKMKIGFQNCRIIMMYNLSYEYYNKRLKEPAEKKSFKGKYTHIIDLSNSIIFRRIRKSLRKSLVKDKQII